MFSGEHRAEKVPISKDALLVIMIALTKAPESQVDSDLRERAQEFLATNPTAVQLYDFLKETSGDCGCSYSTFIAELINVSGYYERPTE